MRIGILGSGLMGGKLGTILARAGHEVVFSYSHSPRKLKRLAREAGGRARAGTPREAAANADALVLAVHWTRVDDVLKQAGDLSGKVIVSCTLPMKKAALVSAFGTVPSEVLFDVFAARKRRRRRPSLLHCGDDADAKKVAARLIRAVGFEPVDAGPLKIARYLEPFTLAMAQLAYEGDGGPEIAYRIERFGRKGRR
jgi:predicted dinucleotide-binding enzyme